MDLSAILNHPDYNEIVSKILDGDDLKDVSKWLKFRYTRKDQGHLRLTVKVLQDFVDSGKLNLYSKLQQDVEIVKSGGEPTGKLEKKLSESLVNNKTYRERLAQIADSEINIKQMIIDLITVCHTRAEQVFDIIQADPTKLKTDHYFLRYMNELFNMLEKYDRIINRAPDQIIQHNVSFQMVEQYTFALQEAVREVLAEMDPEFSMIFIEKLEAKLKGLKKPEEPRQDEKLKQIQLLNEKIMQEDDE